MHRNVSNALKRWSSKTSAHKGEEIAHLCRSCQKLVITQNMLKGIPESSLPDGSLALDLQQGYIDLPMKKGDRSPGFDCLKEAALSRCEFCVSLLDAIHQTRITRKVAWERLDQAGDIVVKFRYCFGPDPGIGTFEAGQWPFILAALEALIQPKNAAPGDPGIVIAFKIHCEPGEFKSIHVNHADFLQSQKLASTCGSGEGW